MANVHAHYIKIGDILPSSNLAMAPKAFVLKDQGHLLSSLELLLQIVISYI